MFTSASHRAASAYKRVAVETSVQGADPHTLVGLLFDALLQSIAEARGAMVRGDTVTKGAALGKAVRILEEGLKAGLNLREGGEVAANLRDLYNYSTLRLTQANLRNDPKALEEVSKLIEPVAQSWKLIGGPGPAYLQPIAGRGA
ncbi:flagellar export chaperone FliS [Hydrogenophaga pseudoflava]|uniref:flagellar export chaperone FliS n=1 Tax=Hydrogenophaga pseudoflava TaxID=47421 RepID=UPI0027E56492|nr:flagellar export chaperone FliS [Hydrogenophaga pseudoflava]MDQ7743597.1 flagellar export chaperone FliS [Hydrogenophaga pseudoflava]